jgi:hypothetical protein
MTVRLALRRESIASTQMAHGSGARCVVVASLETVRSVWRPNAATDGQPLRWRSEAMDAPWVLSSDANMGRRARHARQRTWEAATALAAVDVGEAESHSSAPRMAHQSGHRNRIMVDVHGSSQDGSVIDPTSTGTVRVPGSDEEE